MSVRLSYPHHNCLVNSEQSYYNTSPTLSSSVSNQTKTAIPTQTEGKACDSKSFRG